MTITSTSRRAGPFTGNGAMVSFPFSFKVFSSSDLLVVQAVAATGVESVLVLTAGYSVALNADQNTSPGGTVNLPSALAVGQTLTIITQLPNTQGMDLTNQGGFYPKVLNDASDRAVILIQQLAEKVSRTLQFALSSSGTPALPIPSVRAGGYLAFDASGNPISASGTGSDPALRNDLAAGAGSSLFGFIQAGIGAILRSGQDKLRDFVTLEDFGGVGNGIADDSLALSKAQASLPNGGVIRGLNGKQYYIPLGFTLNKGISFVGTWVTREDVGVHNPLLGCSAILIDGTSTITVANGAEFTKWLVWRKGLVAATSAADAASKVAGFTGTALTVGGADAKVRLNTIIGFNKALVSSGSERGIIEENQFDCTNGIDMSLSYDITHVRRNHGWPFFTVHQSWTTPSLLQRGGSGYRVYGTADFIHVHQNFCYGYASSYYFADLAAGTVTENKADNVISLSSGRIGIETRGNINNVVFNNNHVDSHEVNYRFAHTAGCAVGGVNTSGQSSGPSIQCGAGSNGSFGRFSVGGNCTFVIDFIPGVGKWRIDSMQVSSAASAGAAYNIVLADRFNVQIGWTSIAPGLATDDNLGYGLSTAPFLRPNHASKTGLFVNGGDGTMGVSVNGFPSAIFTPVGAAVNFLTVAAGVAGNRVSLGVDGEANVTLALVPKGTGTLLLSVPYVAATVAQTGYVIMLDSTGTPRRFLIG